MKAERSSNRTTFIRVGGWHATPVFPAGLLTVYILVGGFLLTLGLCGIWNTFRSRQWPSAPGRIESVTVEEPRSGQGTDCYVNVTYHYVLSGQTLLGSGVNLDSKGQVTRSGSEDWLRRYPVGKAVRVYINPDDPYQTVLEFSPTMATAVLLFLGSGSCAVGLLGFFCRALLRREKTVSSFRCQK